MSPYDRDLLQWLAGDIRKWRPRDVAKRIRPAPTEEEIGRAAIVLQAATLAVLQLLRAPTDLERITSDLSRQLVGALEENKRLREEA